MRASTSPLGAELARWGGTQPPRGRAAYCLRGAHCRKRYSYMHPQMRGDCSAVRVRRGSLSSLPALTRPSRERGCVGPSGNNIEYAKANKRRRNRPNPSPKRRGHTRHTRTRTDTRTHVRTPLDPSGVFNPGFINSVSAARRVNGDSSLKPRPPGTARTSCTRPCPRPRSYFEEGSRPGAWCSGRRA